jgi:hypothetical protein
LNSVDWAIRSTSVPEAGELLLQGVAVLAGDGAVGSLDRQFPQPDQDVVDLFQGTLARLGQGDAIVGVALGLVEGADLCAETLGNRKPGSVIGGGGDPQAGGQLPEAGRQ